MTFLQALPRAAALGTQQRRCQKEDGAPVRLEVLAAPPATQQRRCQAGTPHGR